MLKVANTIFGGRVVTQLRVSEVTLAAVHKVLIHPLPHTAFTLTPCTTTCSHAGLFTGLYHRVMMGGERHSPWVILLLLPLVWGEIGPQDCIRFPLIPFAYTQIFVSPKNTIIAENCLPGNDSTEWDVNADGDPSIQVASSDP